MSLSGALKRVMRTLTVLKAQLVTTQEISLSKYSIVQPGSTVGPPGSIPDYIVKPPYAITGQVPPGPRDPEIKTPEQIEHMRTACKLATNILNKTGMKLQVGMTTEEIDSIVHHETVTNNAYPSPLMYKGFPKSVCTSVNNVLCHGIPDSRPLEDGDIINIDISVFYNGYHGDTSATYLIGQVDTEGRRLVQVSEDCLYKGISVCKPGARFSDIGSAICEHAHGNGFNVVPEITGHGIGSYFHGLPHIYHIPYEDPDNTVQTMAPGMTFTIEPVVCEGSDTYTSWDDGWTLVSTDNLRSAQFEHTVLITTDGVEILTQ